MGTGDDSMPEPWASPPLARKVVQIKGGHSGRRTHHRAGSNPPQPSVNLQYLQRAVPREELFLELPNIICEIFKEDISYREQAHKFLWEFFD